jgi:hypothetical protein
MKILRIFFICIFKNFVLLTAQNCDFHYQYNPKIERYTEGYVSKANIAALSLRQVIKIPVVVHVIWKNDVENISDAQIQSQIDVLNKDFRKLNTDLKNVPTGFKDLAADCEIEFCLASRDTSGKSTNGIMRYNTTVDNIGTTFINNKRAVYYSASEKPINWRPSEYLNIWVCRMNNFLGFTTALANAQTTPAEDGIIVDYRVFGTIGTAVNSIGHKNGRTATHEIGHYFNLLHIWGSNNTCDDDDLVTDTPLQAGASSGCPSFPATDNCSPNTMYPNFMDYTNDECMGLFTQGQKTRMMATLNGFRAGLLRGSDCDLVSTQDIDFQWFISPNPARDFIKINLKGSSTSAIKQLYLTDVLGKIILHKKGIEWTQNNQNTEGGLELPLINVPNGFYLLVLNIEGKTISKKIFIQK